MVLDLKILMYRNADEIEKLKKIKADSDQEMATVLQQLKTLSESWDLMQRELEELRDVKDAAQDVAGLMEIPEGNEDEPLTLAGKLHKVPKSFEKFISVSFRNIHGLGYFLDSVPDIPQRDKFSLHRVSGLG